MKNAIYERNKINTSMDKTETPSQINPVQTAPIEKTKPDEEIPFKTAEKERTFDAMKFHGMKPSEYNEFFGDNYKDYSISDAGGIKIPTVYLKDGTEITSQPMSVEVKKNNGFRDAYIDGYWEQPRTTIMKHKFEKIDRKEFNNFLHNIGYYDINHQGQFYIDDENKTTQVAIKLQKAGVTCEDTLDDIKQKLKDYEAKTNKN